MSSGTTTQPVAATEDKDLALLRTQLSTAKKQSAEYIWGGALPVGKDVRALVENGTRAWWEPLTPLERFFLFEISSNVAARAPADVRAEAFCAGIKDVLSDWWSTPGESSTEASKHALELKSPVVRCMVKLFDETKELAYNDGESNALAEQHHWTVADLAAGIVAVSLGETYDEKAEPEKRAARRAELRAKVH